MKIIKTVGGHTSTSSKFVPKFGTQFSLCRLILPQSRVTLILNKLNKTDQKLFDEKFDDPCCIEQQSWKKIFWIGNKYHGFYLVTFLLLFTHAKFSFILLIVIGKVAFKIAKKNF